MIARGWDEQDSIGHMPWPLTRRELDTVKDFGFEEVSFEDYFDLDCPPVRRSRVWRLPAERECSDGGTIWKSPLDVQAR